jgi:hypothetical protein
MWGDWFGSALHFHGMYQMPFLQAIRKVDAPIVMGYVGDALTGSQIAKLMSDKHESLLDRLISKWQLWHPDELDALIRFDLNEAMQQIDEELRNQYREIPGNTFQRIWFIFWWNHIFGFSYYQPMMYDYWKGVATPYLDRDYARFCFSLPRSVLGDRRLQKNMLRRYYPDMAAIGGTYGEPLNTSLRYLLRKWLALKLPGSLHRGPLREFSIRSDTLVNAKLSLRTCGEKALWPINQDLISLRDWLNLNALGEVYAKASTGDEKCYHKLRAIQTIAFRAASSGVSQE